MKKVLSTAILLVAALSPFYSAIGQTETGSQGPRSADKPAAESPNNSSNKESAKAIDTASVKNAPARDAADEARKGAAPAPSKTATDSDEAGLTGIYKVGVGDVLDIRLLSSATNRSTLFTVMDGGLIEFPLVGGSLAVAGLTTDEIQARLSTELKRRAVQDDAQITVGVRQYASHTVMVTGLVGIPGTKILRREAVPLYVVLAEAQPRLDAGRAAVMRAGRLVLTVDLNDSASLNAIIRPGDVINLAARPQDFYYIAGYVNYPGQKIFQSGITLVQAILAAGGLARQTDKVVELSREGPDGRLSTTRYHLRDIKSGKVQDPRLRPGDRIEVVR
jgi:protein involved in polysaccharide export with SLBB domain